MPPLALPPRTPDPHHPPGPPAGPAELRARSDYLQMANPLLLVLAYSLSPALSHTLSTYREHSIKHFQHFQLA